MVRSRQSGAKAERIVAAVSISKGGGCGSRSKQSVAEQEKGPAADEVRTRDGE